MPADELNPNHPTTTAMREQWHKVVVLLMLKMGVRNILITDQEIIQINKIPGGVNIAVKNHQDGLELFLLTNKQASARASQEGGLPN